jgi:hypothetical protein
MCQKYEKPLIIPFSSDDSEVGIGLCANGSANPTSNCENGASAPARHQSLGRI